jgi:hypothetical protein
MTNEDNSNSCNSKDFSSICIGFGIQELIYDFATLKARVVHKKYCWLHDVNEQGTGWQPLLSIPRDGSTNLWYTAAKNMAS